MPKIISQQNVSEELTFSCQMSVVRHDTQLLIQPNIGKSVHRTSINISFCSYVYLKNLTKWMYCMPTCSISGNSLVTIFSSITAGLGQVRQYEDRYTRARQGNIWWREEETGHRLWGMLSLAKVRLRVSGTVCLESVLRPSCWVGMDMGVSRFDLQWKKESNSHDGGWMNRGK